MKNLMTKTLKTLAVAGMTMGLALGAQAEDGLKVNGVPLTDLSGTGWKFDATQMLLTLDGSKTNRFDLTGQSSTAFRVSVEKDKGNFTLYANVMIATPPMEPSDLLQFKIPDENRPWYDQEIAVDANGAYWLGAGTWYLDPEGHYDTVAYVCVVVDDGVWRIAPPVEYRAPVYKEVGGVRNPTNGIERWETLSTNVFKFVTKNTEELSAGWWVVDGTIDHTSAGITVEGTAHLILMDGCSLTVKGAGDCAGITVSGDGNSLAIYGQSLGTGKLTATAGDSTLETGLDSGAAIGGGDSAAGSGITINGGTVTANGNAGGSGIGGGYKGNGSNITINGGTVTATGGEAGGAGIGGGFKGAGWNITINGGTVTAMGGDYAAGIGGGNYGGAGSDITINGGTVTATGDNAAGIGGGLAGAGSNITVRESATVYASTCGDSNFADVIGSGYSSPDAAGGNTIEAGARVFFNLTGQSVAPMPETFEGFTVMTRGTQSVDRVLVGGFAVGDGTPTLPFTLTNAVTGATGTIEINAEKHTDFANTYLRLTDEDGNLTLKADEPDLTITQQPNITNLYTIAATTDGSEGITNYAWCASFDQSLGFVAITNANMKIGLGTVDGETIKSVDIGGRQCVSITFTLDGVNALPKGGSFHFTCAEALTVSAGGTLAQNGSDCVYTPEAPGDGGSAQYSFAFMGSSAFTISDLTYEVTVYDLVAEGATLTRFPAEKGVEGSNYLCRVTHGHCGTPYTTDSEVFEFEYPKVKVVAGAVTGATVLAAYTNDVPLTGSSPWTVLLNADVKVVYEADKDYMFPGGYKTFTTNVTASEATTTVTLTDDQKPIAAVANPNCITFSAAEDFGIKMWKNGTPPTVNLEYSTDQIYWATFNKDDGAAAGADHKLYLRGTGNTAFALNGPNAYTFTNTVTSAATAIACSGNVETLLDYQSVAAGNHPNMGNGAFMRLFLGFETLTAAPDLLATALQNNCYYGMFQGCRSLTAAPDLPATNLANYCYYSMFQGCTSLTDVPELPATNLAKYCYYAMFQGCTSLVVNANAPGKAWSIPAEAETSAALAQDWNKDMFKGTPGDITNTTVTCGVTYYVASALVPVTVELPEVAGATAQLYTFYTQGGWTSVATNEVPSNATVRVVWTAADGNGLMAGGVVNVFQWQAEFVADKAVQEAPQPFVVEGNESSVTLNIDTRTKKNYFEKDDILPVWYAAGAEVKVKKSKLEGEVEESTETIVKSAATTNTVAWLPDSIGVYDLTQAGDLAGQIIYTTPVTLTTNGLEVADTTVEVTVDGAAIPEDGRIATNSTVTVTWTVDASAAGKYFLDGSTTYTASFAATGAESFDAAAILKAAKQIPDAPAEPKVLLGIVAQRYPWDGKIDVQYWAKNTPNEGYAITVTVTLPDGTTASETHEAQGGKHETSFDARKAFGEVAIPKGVKVKASLAPRVP